MLECAWPAGRRDRLGKVGVLRQDVADPRRSGTWR